MIVPSVAALCVGKPRDMGLEGAADPHDRPWTSGIFKAPVQGALPLTLTGFDGDGQADPANHGGPDKAVCVYPADHYPWWRETLSRDVPALGAFGENLSIAGLDEGSVCIGDVWALASGVILQVSQPRQPCWKLARKWRLTAFADQVVKSGRTGWYFRVLQEGVVAAGDRLELVARPHPGWTIDGANGVMHRREGDTAALAAVPELSVSWRQTLTRRLQVPSAAAD